MKEGLEGVGVVLVGRAITDFLGIALSLDAGANLIEIVTPLKDLSFFRTSVIGENKVVGSRVVKEFFVVVKTHGGTMGRCQETLGVRRGIVVALLSKKTDDIRHRGTVTFLLVVDSDGDITGVESLDFLS